MTEREFYWLAGLLEGEGSFGAAPPSEPNRPRIALAMTDEDVVGKVAVLFGQSYAHCRKDSRNPNWKPYYRVQVRGKKAVELMTSLYPLMSSRRQRQIDSALSNYVGRNEGSTGQTSWGDASDAGAVPARSTSTPGGSTTLEEGTLGCNRR